MPDDAVASTHVTLRLPSELVERFDRLATILERPRSWVMHRALRQYLDAEGVEIIGDAESLAELDQGDGAPFAGILHEVERIIKRAEKKRARRK